jgi:hypothetical protein
VITKDTPVSPTKGLAWGLKVMLLKVGCASTWTWADALFDDPATYPFGAPKKDCPLAPFDWTHTGTEGLLGEYVRVTEMPRLA